MLKPVMALELKLLNNILQNFGSFMDSLSECQSAVKRIYGLALLLKRTLIGTRNLLKGSVEKQMSFIAFPVLLLNA